VRTCALVISKCVREHLRRPVIEAECKHSAVGRLHPKQPIARLSIPTARDGLDRNGFDKSIGNLRVAERAPRRNAIGHRPDDIFYGLQIQADCVERERKGSVLASLEQQEESGPASETTERIFSRGGVVIFIAVSKPRSSRPVPS
jgi:hypothetical protein